MFDYNKCRLIFKVDGQELLRHEFSRQEGRTYRYEFDRDWKAGPHELTIEVEPLTPGEKRVRSLSLRIKSVTVRGPIDERYWVRPSNYARFFPRDVPGDPQARHRYARELLGRFATRAFRRPVDARTIDRLVAVVEAVSGDQGQTFEAGVARAMTAVLASPRFLFREEGVEPGSADRYPLLDEYALASRLSYFLWSSMPDDELFRLAGEHKLRANLPAQVKRMLADPRSAEFFRHFVGQWLQARDIETVLINAAAVIARDAAARSRGGSPAGAIPGAQPQAAGKPHGRGERGAEGSSRGLLWFLPAVSRIRAHPRLAAGHAAGNRDALRAHRA